MKLLLSLVLLSFTLFAQDAFVSSEYLLKNLNNKNLVIIDTTNKETFKKGHIPHAVQADISLFRHMVYNTYALMNSPQIIQKAARSLGINNDSTVIIYGHNRGKELLKSSYMALALLTNGVKDVALLNGGYGDWQDEYEDEKGLISIGTHTNSTGNLKVHFNPNIIVNREYVELHIGTTPMIEARPKVYYDAKKQSKGVKRLGHIKAAQSSFWRDKFNLDDTLKSDEELGEIFFSKNHLHKNKEVITYCTGGLEASMNWYILHQYLHFKDVKLYDASMRQWGNLNSTPMEK